MNSPEIYEFNFQLTGDTYTIELTELLEEHFHERMKGDRSDYGIYLATATAGMDESVAFWNNTLKQTPAFANPANFPFTLSNAPASCMAKALGVKGPVYTMVGGKDALMACLLNASADFDEGVVKNIFIVGFDRKDITISMAGMLLTGSCDEYISTLSGMLQALDEMLPSELMHTLIGFQKSGMTSQTKITGVSSLF